MEFLIARVELNGACSNPQVVLEVDRTTKLKARLQAKKGKSPDPKKVRVRPGLVAKTVYMVLSEAQTSMRAKEIQRTCETRLGHEVSWSTVKACLSKHSKESNPKYLRVGYGR